MEQQVLTQDQIDTFLEKLQDNGKSPNVIAEYRRNLNRLYRCAEKYAFALDENVLLAWKKEQEEKQIAPGTLTNRVVKINHFLRYLGLENMCFPNGGRQNLAGKRFGNLLVLKPTEHRSADRSICWKCRCMICGNEKEIPANQLKKGVQLSCGCDRAKRLQETNGYIEGTCLKNVFSEKLSKNNTSGYKGVYQKRGKWVARIQYKKKNYYLGAYDRLEDAVNVRKQAENWVRDDAKKLLEHAGETKEKNPGKEIYEH